MIRRVLRVLVQHVKPILQVLEIERERRVDRLELIQHTDFENNPYRKVHLRAAAREHRKQKVRQSSENWYADPLRFFYSEDLYYEEAVPKSKKYLIAMAYEAFRTVHDGESSLIEYALLGQIEGNDVEQEVLVRLFAASLKSLFKKTMRSTQIQTLILEREAHREGASNIAGYIAMQLGITQRSAERRLKTARQRLKTVGNRPISSIIEIEADVRKVAFVTKRACAVCGKITRNGFRSLCDACHRRFRYEDDRSGALKPEEVETLAIRATAQHMYNARKVLYPN